MRCVGRKSTLDFELVEGVEAAAVSRYATRQASVALENVPMLPPFLLKSRPDETSSPAEAFRLDSAVDRLVHRSSD